MPLLATAAMALMMMQGAGAGEKQDAPAAPYTTLSQRLHSWVSFIPLDKLHFQSKRRSTRIKTEGYYTEGNWAIRVKDDKFTGKIQCVLYPKQVFHANDISYADGVLGLRHHFDANPSDIWFRVDNNDAKPWTSVYRDLHARGLMVATYRTGVGSEDVLLIPEEEVMDADEVTLRLAKKSKPERFNISGFGEALRVSKTLGCTDGNYVRKVAD